MAMAASSSRLLRLTIHLPFSPSSFLHSYASLSLAPAFSASSAISKPCLASSILWPANTNLCARPLPEARLLECVPPPPPSLCGRGDKKTKKGKRFKGSFGKRRMDRGEQIRRLKTKWELPTDAPLPFPNQEAHKKLLCRRFTSSTCDMQQVHTTEFPRWRQFPAKGEVFHEEVQVSSDMMTFETGKLAQFAAGAVVVGIGETNVLATVVSDERLDESRGFMPLQVDYREKNYAQGKIPNTFMRREGAPKERELLCGRVIDRTIRPLFPKGYYCETQIMANVLSSDGEQDPDVLAANAASAALTVSDVPWNGPVGVVRVGRVNGEFVVNPSMDALSESDLNLIYACTAERTMMIETQAREITNEDYIAALHLAHSEAAKLIPPQLRLARKVKNQKRPVEVIKVDESILEIVRGLAEAPIQEIVRDPSYGKFERGKTLGKVQDDVQAILKEEGKDDAVRLLSLAFDLVKKQVVRRNIFENASRVDGRSLDDIRDLYCESGIYPALHGSSLFSRGNTQVLCTVTIGSPEEAQRLDSLVGPPRKRFMVHYSFPPFSINEVGKLGGLNRREVGHGTLAEKALLALLPPEDDDFPYSVRVTSEVLASDGSSSMATVCGGSIALMDAGIPLKEHVAGVSVGLMTDVDSSTGEIKDYRILTDILGLEDHLGDMDFKIAGTRKGITAIQLDIKLPGVPLHILCESLEPARKARIHILEAMEQEISKPRDPRENTPHRGSMAIQRESIGRLIGPQGANVKNIQRVTGANLTVTDEGIVIIMAKDRATFFQAKDMVETSIGKDIEVGGTYTGTVVAIKDFGAFIEFDGGQQGLLHISELSHEHVPSVADFVTIGQKLPVICIGRDFRGNLKFSYKATLQPPERTPKIISSSDASNTAKPLSSETINIKEEKKVSASDIRLVNEVTGVSGEQISVVVTNSFEPMCLSKSQEVKQTTHMDDQSTTHMDDQSACLVDNNLSSSRLQPKPNDCKLPDSMEQKQDSIAEVGAEYNVTVKQVRLYGAVVQMSDGALGALRLDKEIKDGRGPKLELGDCVVVECRRIGSKGRPSFIFKRNS